MRRFPSSFRWLVWVKREVKSRLQVEVGKKVEKGTAFHIKRKKRVNEMSKRENTGKGEAAESMPTVFPVRKESELL